MIDFFSYLLQILLCSSASLLVGGIAAYFCYRLFCLLIGAGRGKRILLFFHAFITPVRELAHLTAAVLFLHRVTDFRLLKLHDPDGELGYVEHSYNRQNPIALLGNYVFALLPALLGLALLLAAMLLFAGEATLSFFSELAALEHFDLATISPAFGRFFAALGAAAAARPLRALLVAALLLVLCLGIHVSIDDLRHALSGFLAFGLLCALLSCLLMLFDPRLSRILCAGLRVFALGSAALYLPVLAASLLLVGFGLLFFLLSSLFSFFRPKRGEEDAEEESDEEEQSEVIREETEEI